MAKLHKNIDPELLAKELKELAGQDIAPEELQRMLESDLERDALEGFIAMKKTGVNTNKAIVDLQHQLNQKLKDRSRQRELPWHKLSIAATIAAVVGIGAFYIIKKQNNDRLMASREIDELFLVHSNDTLLIYLPKEALAHQQEITQNIVKTSISDSKRQLTVKDKKDIVNPKPTTPAAVMTAPTAAQAAAIEVDTSKAIQGLLAETVIAKRSVAKSALRETLINKQLGIHIQAIDLLTNKPIENVKVQVSGTQTTALTNTEGEVNLPTSSTKSEVTLSKENYITETIKPKEAQQKFIYGLMPDVKKLAKVAVEQFLTKPNPENAPPKLAIEDASYRIYINKNIAYPKEFTEMGREGTVELEFTVNTNGMLSNFKVLKSMGPEFDQSSIEALKHGPLWIPAIVNGKPSTAKARYYVNFIHL
ncbi:energy transducer TonB [Solitalea lacus]|uniref:energy transducer TonB n=1 Tax=Solitalea lacus TaxID=2911172 RepID=UPI001EDBC8CB|nr:energy transducer TonB [Solitalea lacus]UKJ07847.1 energy transducer TonB [Solitalea lacus]